MKCNVGFERCLELHNHILQEHPNAQRITRCGFAHCKKCFSNATMLQAHLKQNHMVTKPFDLLNSIKSGSTSTARASTSSKNSSSSSSKSSAGSSHTSTSKNSDTSSFTSAWTMPDPPSPPPAETAPSSTREKADPDLTCKICNKTHKSQTSYNNHMLVFHKEKYKSSKPAAKKRRLDDDTTSESDAESEDSDWVPTNRSKRTASRQTRTNKKQAGKVNNGEMKARHPSAGSDTSVANNEPGPEPPTTPRKLTPPISQQKQSPPTPQNQQMPPTLQHQQTTPTLQHQNPSSLQHKQGNHGIGDCDDCLACKAQANKAAPNPVPPIRIKQEPLDPSDPPPGMPIISNVYSTMTHPMHPVPHPGIHQPMQPMTNGYADFTKASTHHPLHLQRRTAPITTDRQAWDPTIHPRRKAGTA